MRYLLKLISLIACAWLITACAKPPGATVADQRMAVNNMKNQTLALLYQKQPKVQQEIESAAGYAVFSNVGMHFIFMGNDHGYGEVVDNTTGQVTYMRMTELNAGLGLQMKQYRNVFVFNNPQTLNSFITNGWQFGGSADATAVSGGEGVSSGGEVYANENLKIYQLSKSGLSLQASLGGVKYWKDKALN